MSRKSYLLVSVAAVGAIATTNASAWQSPTEHRYLTEPLQLCDRGTFYVGGAPKVTQFAASATGRGSATIHHRPDVCAVRDPHGVQGWPLIMVHGSGYTGSAVEGTAGGNEGWADYTVRHGVPTYVVDQPGRGRSGFDHSPIHEAVYKLNNGDIPGASGLAPGGGTLPAFGFSHEGTQGWNAWFGHIVRPVPTSRQAQWSAMARGRPAVCNGTSPLQPIGPSPHGT